MSHSPFAYNWQCRFLNSEPVVTRTMYACCLLCVWIRHELYFEKKCFFSYSFDSVNGAKEDFYLRKIFMENITLL